MSGMLTLRDLLAVAEEVHRELDGRMELWPIFNLVRWTDQRMGLRPITQEVEIRGLVIQTSREKDLYGESTSDAIAFKRLGGMIGELLPIARVAILKKRREKREKE